MPVGRARSTIPHLSHALRHDFFRRLSEGRIGVEKHRLVVGVPAERLTETAGLEQAASPEPPDMAALLQTAVRGYEGRRFPVEAGQVV